MLKVILAIVLLFAFIGSIVYLMYRRKSKGIKGFKSLLTPLCFYAIAIVSFFIFWTETFGLLGWTMNIILLFLAAYFSKYIPRYES